MLLKNMTINLSNVELFNELAEIAERTRSLLLKAELEGNDVQRLGHCGLCAEFTSSFGFAIMDVRFDRGDGKSENEVTQNFKNSVLEVAQNSSELSSDLPEIAGDLMVNEVVADAISRSIQDLREWAKNSDHGVSVEINALADRADEVYNPIKEAIKSELKL